MIKEEYSLKIRDAALEVPKPLQIVLVFTKEGRKYVAARYEINKTMKWGLVYNGKFIGDIPDVSFWSYIKNENISNK